MQITKYLPQTQQRHVYIEDESVDCQRDNYQTHQSGNEMLQY